MVEQKRGNSSQQVVPTGGTQSVDTGKEVRAFDGVERQRSMELAANAASAAAKAEVEAGYIMAMHHPRNEDDARVKILERCKNLRFAESALYRKPVGEGKSITGLSVRFAEEIMRCWKNIKVIQSVIYEDNFKRLIKETVIDLEANMSYSSEITIEKHVERKSAKNRTVLRERVNSSGNKVFIVEATEDEMQIKAGALSSKLMRNNGLKCIPSHIKTEAKEIINSTVRARVDKDPEAYKRQVLDGFANIGVQPSDLEKHMGLPVAKLSPLQIQELRDIYNSIKEGESSWADYVNNKKENAKMPEAADMKDLFKPGDQASHTHPGKPLTGQGAKGSRKGGR